MRLGKILRQLKDALTTANIAIASSLRYRKGNHEGAIAGIVAGLSLLGGF